MHDGPWERLLTALENKLPPQVVDTWIRPGRLLACRDTHLDIGVPSPFIRSYVVKHYLPQLQMAAEECLGSGIQVTVSIDRASAAPSASPIPSPALASAPPVGDSRYTFNTFVVGSSNQFAQAACLAVAKQPSTAYNPLFLYGGVGLGKTHLLRAIGHEVSRTRPHLRADYLSTEKFTNELIGAIRSDKTREFRQRHRTIDLLLVDDVQFLSGKERTQEEFFHTFNDLYESRRQIILSSDRSPREIPDIEERLRSRFQWGLIADIHPPDFETRLAILKTKAELDRLPLPEDVASFIASTVKSNIRELEGCLVRIRAFCHLSDRALSLDLAQECLANLWRSDHCRVTIDDIHRRVAEVFKIRPHDLCATTRSKAVAFPRQVAMYLARRLTNDSYADIGRGFGGKDHTTVLHAVRKIATLLQKDPTFQKTLDHLINTIRIH